MRDGGPRFPDSSSRLGTHGSSGNGRPATFANSARFFKGGAALPKHGLHGTAAVVGLLIVAILSLGAASASADYRHTGVGYSFGSDGTGGTTVPSLMSVAYDKAGKKLYALSKTNPTTVYGFSYEAPSSFPPLGGNFPLEVEKARLEGADLAVDNTNLASAGHFLYSVACGCPTSFTYAFNSVGEELFFVNSTRKVSAGGNPANEIARSEGVAVDNEGHIWVASAEVSKLEEFEPTGGSAIKTIETESFGGNPRRLAIDQLTNDMYVAVRGGVWRLPAASGYAPASAELIQKVSTDQPAVSVAVDGSTHRLYTALWKGNNGVTSINTDTGFVVEQIAKGADHRGVAVDETSHAVFLSNFSTNKVEEWPATLVPEVTTGDQIANTVISGSVGLAEGPEVVDCYFEFGVHEEGEPVSYTGKETCSPSLPYTTDQPEVTADLEGSVTLENTYDYRLVAKSTNGILVFGVNHTFTPHNVAFLRAEPATNIDREAARLNGSFFGEKEKTKYYFEWGLGTEYENQTPEEETGETEGSTVIFADIEGLSTSTTYHYRVVAENEKGRSVSDDATFTTAPAIKEIHTLAATDRTTTSATLNGSLDPDGYETTFYFEYGGTTAYGHTVPAPPGVDVGSVESGLTQVSEQLTGLQLGTTYHYRVVGTNETGLTRGQDETFTTTQPPSVVAFSSTNVTATSAELTAVINPNGFDTTYYFDYGKTEGYGSIAQEVEPAGAGEGPVSVSVPIGGLEEVTYHFRLVAENQWGRTETTDQTFDFALPIGCPNDNLRQQTGAGYLPDCRAYEIVSPERAGGALLFYQGPSRPYASGSGRFAFAAILNGIPDSGEPSNGSLLGDPYVASRTDAGWKTRFVGVPGSKTLQSGSSPTHGYRGPSGIPADRGMNRLLIWDLAEEGSSSDARTGTMAPYVVDNEGNFLEQLPTNLAEIPGATLDRSEGGYVGDTNVSLDFSHYVFGSRNLAFAVGGLEETPGSVYDNNRTSNTVTVVSKTAQGEDIPAGIGGGFQSDFIRIPAVSEDGSHILMSTAAPGETVHLYMRVADAVSYDVSRSEVEEGHPNRPVTFEGMTPDGSSVYFTTNEQLTADDEDESVDLFMWNEESDEVLRLSRGSTETGNSAECNVLWTTGCDVTVVPTTRESFNGPEPPIDTAIAADTGEIYFYSPEELDGNRGAFGKRNLYVYRNGAARHVATLEPESPVTRMQVTPDGKHMAMLSGSQLTGYDNNGVQMMYRFDTNDWAMTCVSCRPDGAKPGGEAEGSQNGLFVSDDGRTFFSTIDDLVPRDADGIVDVYEYVGGRPHLISSGFGDPQSVENQRIGLVGASADGIDVFFATTDTLVPQDENGEYLKYYDARTNGGFPYAKPPAPCAAADECHGTESGAPNQLSIGTSASLSVNGNAQRQRRHASRKRHRRAVARCRKKRRGTRRCLRRLRRREALRRRRRQIGSGRDG